MSKCCEKLKIQKNFKKKTIIFKSIIFMFFLYQFSGNICLSVLWKFIERYLSSSVFHWKLKKIIPFAKLKEMRKYLRINGIVKSAWWHGQVVSNLPRDIGGRCLLGLWYHADTPGDKYKLKFEIQIWNLKTEIKKVWEIYFDFVAKNWLF